jgi:hydroxymethylbilane synthase
VQVRTGEVALSGALDHAETRRRVEAERRCLAAVGGGCLAPVAAHHDGATLRALVAADDGSWLHRVSGDDAETIGRELAALAAAS